MKTWIFIYINPMIIFYRQWKYKLVMSVISMDYISETKVLKYFSIKVSVFVYKVISTLLLFYNFREFVYADDI